MTVTVRGGLCTFMIISGGVFLRIRNISDISCRENQNTHFVLDSLFYPKMLPFMIKCENIQKIQNHFILM
jgi:hypothetical protein